MTTRAAQIECLLTPVIDYRTNSVAAAYTAYFYSAGTSSPKNVWTEKEKTNPYTSRTLGSDGTAQLYGDGAYKIVIKDTDGTTVHSWDNIKVQANTFTVQTKSDTYTAVADDDLILAGGTFTINIATVAGFSHPLIIKRTSGTITVDPYSTETIDGSSTITLTASDDSAVLYPDVSAGVWRRADRLGGLTANVSELNILDGVTATTGEINSRCDGIPSHITDTDTSITITSTLLEVLEIDLGTLTDGDVFILTVYVSSGTKGGTAGVNEIFCTKKSGTGDAYIGGTLSGMEDSRHYEASQTVYQSLTSVWEVTATGTLVMYLAARSAGSDTTTASVKSFATFIKKQ